MQKAIEFLKALKKNNNRVWFNENKALYEQAFLEFKIFAAKMHKILSETDYYAIY